MPECFVLAVVLASCILSIFRSISLRVTVARFFLSLRLAMLSELSIRDDSLLLVEVHLMPLG